MVRSNDKSLPAVSILTYTYNGEKCIKECLASLFSQDYPIKKIEWIIADGGSKDKTVEIIQEYAKKHPKIIRFYESPTEHSYAGNEGYSMFARKVSNELVLFLEQEDILVQKDWLKNMVRVFVENKKISAVQSRIATPKKGSSVEKYLGAIGINDPFAIPYSLNAQLTLNPGKFKYNPAGDFYVYQASTKNFLYAGGGGFMIRKGAFFNSGGWIQDTDLFYRMGMNHYIVAIPRKLRIMKKNARTLREFLAKRGFHVQYYLSKNYYGRDFYWFDLKKNSFGQNIKFIKNVIGNLLFVPGIFTGLKMFFKSRSFFWLLHPVMQFSITSSYIFVRIYAMLTAKSESGEF